MRRTPLFLFVKGFSLFIFIISCDQVQKKNEPPDQSTSWGVYRGDEGSNAYSRLNQINRENVKDLEVAWVYRSGDSKHGTSIQCNPIIIDDTLYATLEMAWTGLSIRTTLLSGIPLR